MSGPPIGSSERIYVKNVPANPLFEIIKQSHEPTSEFWVKEFLNRINTIWDWVGEKGN